MSLVQMGRSPDPRPALDWFVLAFLKASLVWLGLGVTLGLVMAASPNLVVYRAAHTHMNLLGFVSMMIFGVAFHVIPRFVGRPLHSARQAGWTWVLANLGLLGLVTGFLARPHLGQTATPVIAGGGMIAATGAYLFIWNIWRTLAGAGRVRASAGRSPA